MFSNYCNFSKYLKSILFNIFLCVLVLSLLCFEADCTQEILGSTKRNLKFKPYFRNRQLATEGYSKFDVKSELLHKALNALITIKNDKNKLIRKRRQLPENSAFPISEFGYDESDGRFFSAGERGIPQNQNSNRNQFADFEPNAVITPTPELNFNPLSSFNNLPFTDWPSFNPYVDFPQYPFGGIDEYVPTEGSGVYEGYDTYSRGINNRNNLFTTSTVGPTTYTSTTSDVFGQTTTDSTLPKPITQTSFEENIETTSYDNFTISATQKSTTDSQHYKTNMTTYFTSLINNNTNFYNKNSSSNSSFFHTTLRKKPYWVEHKRKVLLSVLIPVVSILIVFSLAGIWICFFAEKWKTRRIGIELQPKNGNHAPARDSVHSSERSSRSSIELPKPNGNNHVEAWSRNSYHIE